MYLSMCQSYLSHHSFCPINSTLLVETHIITSIFINPGKLFIFMSRRGAALKKEDGAKKSLFRIRVSLRGVIDRAKTEQHSPIQRQCNTCFKRKKFKQMSYKSVDSSKLSLTTVKCYACSVCSVCTTCSTFSTYDICSICVRQVENLFLSLPGSIRKLVSAFT